MKIYKVFLALLIILTIIFGYVFYQRNFLKGDLVLGNGIEIKNESIGNLSLYKKQVKDQGGKEKKLFFTLDISDNKNFLDKSLEKLHTNTFWDPKKCSQMQFVLGKNKIIFVDSFLESEGDPGFSAFIFVYDIGTNKLFQYESPISINKIYKIDNDLQDEFYIISKDKKIQNNYKLYKIDLENKKFVFVKNYLQEEGYGLVTATSTLVWCKGFETKCFYDQENKFERENKPFYVEKTLDNVFKIKEFYKNELIFELKEADKVRSFILGVI